MGRRTTHTRELLEEQTLVRHRRTSKALCDCATRTAHVYGTLRSILSDGMAFQQHRYTGLARFFMLIDVLEELIEMNLRIYLILPQSDV